MGEQKHNIRWFAYASNHSGDTERFRYTHMMRNRTWKAFDAECSCGWKSRTGGAIKERVKEYVQEHKSLVSHGLE